MSNNLRRGLGRIGIQRGPFLAANSRISMLTTCSIYGSRGHFRRAFVGIPGHTFAAASLNGWNSSSTRPKTWRISRHLPGRRGLQQGRRARDA